MVEKSINLISLVDAFEKLPECLYRDYIESKQVSLPKSEVEDITKFTHFLKRDGGLIHNEGSIFNDFYVGFTINQISKEFDLLRIGENFTVNIEIKSTSTHEKILKQLKNCHYYLSTLETEYFCFTFLAESEEIYIYNREQDNIDSIQPSELINYLIQQEVKSVNDINSLFDPTEFLVSPFNSTEKFMKGDYFLTDHQENIKKEIIDDPTHAISIEGKAGTGKSLLIYDVAKSFIDMGQKVIIVHCGKLNEGHSKLISNYQWNIKHIKYFREALYKSFDLIIIDESQRLRRDQFQTILTKIQEDNLNCIFAFDPEQRLHTSEIYNEVPNKLKDLSNRYYKLSGKIRTNKEINSFLKNLVNLNKTQDQDYSNIELQYFSNIDNAKEFIQEKEREDWTAINYTNSIRTVEILDDYILPTDKNAHNVIGQEFDNVILLLGTMFKYNENGHLTVTERSYYDSFRMLLQIATRTRKKLLIVIVNNDNLLRNILRIAT